eukprot:TRINITY_DN35551_c0_g1_i1.p1 TRINITY_DN35551_c0_g1~~TRINITY_DN35551_c0_g1_i1.p1  ORF type:complete len:103 (-),score=34.80 TRINITY_DN35551_c0_g1_i1:89-397(-)
MSSDEVKIEVDQDQQVQKDGELEQEQQNGVDDEVDSDSSMEVDDDHLTTNPESMIESIDIHGTAVAVSCPARAGKGEGLERCNSIIHTLAANDILVTDLGGY